MASRSFPGSFAALALRLALAAIFFWAAYPKLFLTMPVEGESAAQLANAGLLEPISPGSTAPDTPDSLPAGGGTAGDADAEAFAPIDGVVLSVAFQPDPAEPTGDVGGSPERPTPPSEEQPADGPPTAEPPVADTSPPAAEPEPAPSDPAAVDPLPIEPEPAEPTRVERPVENAAPESADPPVSSLSERASASEPRDAELPEPSGNVTINSGVPYTAEDFPEPIDVRRYHGLALALLNGAEARQGVQSVPDFAVSNPMVLRGLTLSAAIVELIAAVLLAFGVLSRLWALSLVGVMATAMWMTSVAPWIGETDAFLGFLPPLAYDTPSWTQSSFQVFLFQLVILAASLTVLCIGPGALSIDRMIFGPPRRRDDDD